MSTEEILKQCTIENNVVRLPDIKLDRKIYQEIAGKIKLIGGAWKGGKIAGFVFQEDPTELFKQISNGEKRNIKKEFQFYATPEKIANILAEIGLKSQDSIYEIRGCYKGDNQLFGEEELLDEFRDFETALQSLEDYRKAYLNTYSDIHYVAVKLEKKTNKKPFTGNILEPSAGQGAIIKAIHRIAPDLNIDYCESMPLNQTFLEKLDNVNFVADDFLSLDKKNYYDLIIANPPFAKNQDIDHINKMYECLKVGGRLVTIASKHWLRCMENRKKEKAFRNWIAEIDATIIPLDSDTFKESGAVVSSVILVIDKV